jgi:hypothetical protein
MTQSSIQAPALSVSDIFKESWSLAYKQLGKMVLVLFGVALVPIMLAAIPIIIQVAMTGANGNPKDSPLSTIAALCVFLPAMAFTLPCWLRACVRAAEQKSFTMRELIPPFPTILNAAGTFLLLLIVVSAGMLLLVIPGIFLSVKLQLSLFYAAEKGLNPIESLKASWEATSGLWWPIFGIDLIFGMLSNISSWLVIGPIFVSPAVGVAMALIYCKTQVGTDSAAQ